MCKRNTGLGCGKLHTSEVTKAPREKYFAFIHTSSSLTFTAASGFVSHSNLKVYSGIFQIMYLTGKPSLLSPGEEYKPPAGFCKIFYSTVN